MVKNQVGLKIWCLRVLWYRIVPILHSVCFEIKHRFELHNNVQRAYEPNEPLTILVIIVHNIHKDFTFNSVVRNLMIIHFITSDRRRTMSFYTPKQTFSCTLCDEWSHYISLHWFPRFVCSRQVWLYQKSPLIQLSHLSTWPERL